MGDLLYGIHPLCEALVAGRRRFNKLHVSKRRRTKGIRALLELARAQGVPIESQDHEFFLSRFGDSTHQGVAADVSSLPLADQGAILKKAENEGELPLILALDGIVDPQNLGSLVRTALAMGVHGVVTPKVRAAPLSPAVSKASAGAMEHMLFSRVPNLVVALEQLKKAGLWVVGTHAESGKPVDQVDLNISLALVIGGEGKGMRPLVRKTCDYLVSIPQKTELDSLNAAVAGAIVMYEVGRQRREARGKGHRAKGVR
jgi:23S rRNA (guanosine2251-2'-O)-methyltransferase